MATQQHGLYQPDILELIVELLSFTDLCNVRLVSRTFATRSRTFRRYCTTKTVSWASKEQMEEFVHLTQANATGCLLQHLTVVGVVPVVSLEGPCDDALLIKALTNLQYHSTQGHLQSISLSVRGLDSEDDITVDKMGDTNYTPEWRLNSRKLWLTAARTFEVVCRALSKSMLPVEKLDVFGCVRRCSIACEQIAFILDSTGLCKPFRNLKSLTLSLSHRVPVKCREEDSDYEDSDDNALELPGTVKKHAEDLVRFFELCPQLENIDLQWFVITTHGSDDEYLEGQSIYSHILQLEHFSQIRHCRLSGIQASETVLLAFLQKMSKLSHFTMEEMTLDTGSFYSILNHLTNYAEHLEYLHLDSLYESQKLVYFEGPENPPLRCCKHPECALNTLTALGSECHRTVKYRVHLTGRTIGSPALYRWRNRRSFLYGPIQWC